MLSDFAGEKEREETSKGTVAKSEELLFTIALQKAS